MPSQKAAMPALHQVSSTYYHYVWCINSSGTLYVIPQTTDQDVRGMVRVGRFCQINWTAKFPVSAQVGRVPVIILGFLARPAEPGVDDSFEIDPDMTYFALNEKNVVFIDRLRGIPPEAWKKSNEFHEAWSAANIKGFTKDKGAWLRSVYKADGVLLLTESPANAVASPPAQSSHPSSPLSPADQRDLNSLFAEDGTHICSVTNCSYFF